MTIKSNIRIQLLGTNDDVTLTDEYVGLMISDAKDDTDITDETSKLLRYYTCYLIALNWDSIGAVRSREGVTYVPPDTQKYLDKYNDSLSKDLDSSSSLSVCCKESTTEGNIIEDNGVMVKGDYPDSSN